MSTPTSIERLRDELGLHDPAMASFLCKASDVRALLDELDALRGLLTRYVEQDEQTGLVENNLYRAARATLNTKEAK